MINIPKVKKLFNGINIRQWAKENAMPPALIYKLLAESNTNLTDSTIDQIENAFKTSIRVNRQIRVEKVK